MTHELLDALIAYLDARAELRACENEKGPDGYYGWGVVGARRRLEEAEAALRSLCR